MKRLSFILAVALVGLSASAQASVSCDATCPDGSTVSCTGTVSCTASGTSVTCISQQQTGTGTVTTCTTVSSCPDPNKPAPVAPVEP